MTIQVTVVMYNNISHDVCCAAVKEGKQGRQSINHVPNDNMPLNWFLVLGL